MATKVVMEALSPTMEEGRLVKWLKNEGDQIKNGETLAEVETDKAIMELVARGEGVLRKRLLAVETAEHEVQGPVNAGGKHRHHPCRVSCASAPNSLSGESASRSAPAASSSSREPKPHSTPTACTRLALAPSMS